MLRQIIFEAFCTKYDPDPILDKEANVIGWAKNFPNGTLGYATTIKLWWFNYEGNPVFIDIYTF